MKLFLTLATCLILTSNSVSAAKEDPIRISMVQLLANPDAYQGKKIAVSGFLHLEFEGDAIYLHEDDSKNQIYKNGFWVSCKPEIAKKFNEASDGYVMIVGRFSTKTKGHLGLWSGTIEKIERVILRPLNRNE